MQLFGSGSHVAAHCHTALQRLQRCTSICSHSAAPSFAVNKWLPFRCTKITHRAIRAVREAAIYTIPSEKLMLQGNFATNTFLNGEIDCCRSLTFHAISPPYFSFRQHVTVLFHGFLPPLIYDLNHLSNRLVVIVQCLTVCSCRVNAVHCNALRTKTWNCRLSRNQIIKVPWNLPCSGDFVVLTLA